MNRFDYSTYEEIAKWFGDHADIASCHLISEAGVNPKFDDADFFDFTVYDRKQFMITNNFSEREMGILLDFCRKMIRNYLHYQSVIENREEFLEIMHAFETSFNYSYMHRDIPISSIKSTELKTLIVKKSFHTIGDIASNGETFARLLNLDALLYLQSWIISVSKNPEIVEPSYVHFLNNPLKLYESIAYLDYDAGKEFVNRGVESLNLDERTRCCLEAFGFERLRDFFKMNVYLLEDYDREVYDNIGSALWEAISDEVIGCPRIEKE